MICFSEILWMPVLPWWLLFLCGIVFAVLSWRGYAQCRLTVRERIVLWVLRMAAFLLLSWMLALPVLRRHDRKTELPIVAIAVDASASMEENPLGVPENRAVRAKEYLEKEILPLFSGKAQVRVFGMGEKLLEGWDNDKYLEPRSNISDSLESLAARFRGNPLAGIVLLSDGLDQSINSLDAGRLGVPIFVPELEEAVGSSLAGKADFGIGALSCPRRVTAGWKTKLQVSVRRLAGKNAEKIPVRLLQDGRVLQEESADFGERTSLQKVNFELEPETVGPQVYQVQIEPRQDDVAENNQKELLLEVTDSKRRVLYLEGTQRWEFKFLKRSLSADSSLQLNAFLRTGTGAFLHFDGSGTGGVLPELNASALRPYQWVVLGDLKEDALKESERMALKKFAEDGGALLFLGSLNSLQEGGIVRASEFKSLVPVQSLPESRMREGRFSVDFTAEGRALPAFSSLAEEGRLPPLLTLWAPVKMAQFSTAYLASGDGSPLLAGCRVGQGRCAILLSDTLWRWQFGESNSAGKGLYGRFMMQLLTWLSPHLEDKGEEEELQLLLAETEVDLNQKLVIGAIGTGNAAPECTITSPSGKSVKLPMVAASLGEEVGLAREQKGYRCEFVPGEQGAYHLEANSADGTKHATGMLLARLPERERTGEAINRVWLHTLAEASGGSWTSWNQRHSLMEQLHLEPVSREILREEPLWNRWYGLAILLALFCLEWYLRRKWELV